MKIKSFLLITLTFLVFSCQEKTTKDSPKELKQLITDYYKAIDDKNFNKMKELTTYDFKIYEDGKIWNNDSVIAVIKSWSKFNSKYTVSDFKINIDYSSGYTTYSNKAQFVLGNNATETMTSDGEWIESATFVKSDNGWKINLIHSTTKQ